MTRDEMAQHLEAVDADEGYIASTVLEQALYETLGIAAWPDREALFDLAWVVGHHDGYRRVFHELEELVNLIRSYAHNVAYDGEGTGE